MKAKLRKRAHDNDNDIINPIDEWDAKLNDMLQKLRQSKDEPFEKCLAELTKEDELLNQLLVELSKEEKDRERIADVTL
ncbi:MAG TPA: hypothetical protein VEG44_01775 [Candidatus Acidoferrales bacterium]|nr:hypothetical protein [Candidatus Acidoferrales bacterium]